MIDVSFCEVAEHLSEQIRSFGSKSDWTSEITDQDNAETESFFFLHGEASRATLNFDVKTSSKEIWKDIYRLGYLFWGCWRRSAMRFVTTTLKNEHKLVPQMCFLVHLLEAFGYFFPKCTKKKAQASYGLYSQTVKMAFLKILQQFSES